MSYSSVKRGTFNLTKKQQNKTLQVNSKCSQMFEKTFKKCLNLKHLHAQYKKFNYLSHCVGFNVIN